MTTIILILCIITSALFALCYKAATHRNSDLHVVNAWMYVGGLVVMSVVILIKGHLAYHPTAIILGGLSGILSFAATLTFFLHIGKGQLSVSWTVISLSAAFPILASIFIWHEQPSIKQAIGLILVIAALILFGRKEMKSAEEDK